VDQRQQLFTRFRAFPDYFREVLTGLSNEQLHARSGDAWSIHQTVLHILDAELVGAMRLRMVAAQNGAQLASYAGDLWAANLDYPAQDVDAVETIRVVRRATVEMLAAVSPDAWLHQGVHEETGPVNLEVLLAGHIQHAEEHLGEIHRIRKSFGAAAPLPE